MTLAQLLPAALHGVVATTKTERLVIVQDDGPVRVRWRLGRELPWRCDSCGTQAEATCDHTYSAALVLSEALLGLTRNPQLKETKTP